MKKLFLYSVFLVIPFLSHAQDKEQKTIIKRNRNTIIQSVEFSESDKSFKTPDSAGAFFKNYLGVSSHDQFKKVPHKSKKSEFVHEHFDQYYKGVKVDGAGYNFHYKNRIMYFAHGYYVKIKDVNPLPAISTEDAKKSFIKYKNIPPDSVTSFMAELMIKEISNIEQKDTMPIPKLVYKISLYANHANNNELGFIDAQTGNVLFTEPALIDFAAAGTFATRYSGLREGITQNYSGAFHLADSTRGAIIHTWNLDGSTNITNRIELSDNDNNWAANEHSTSENNMGLDVHWALQRI